MPNTSRLGLQKASKMGDFVTEDCQAFLVQALTDPV